VSKSVKETLYVAAKDDGWGTRGKRLVIYPVLVMARGKKIKVAPLSALSYRTLLSPAELDRWGVRATPEDAVAAFRLACEKRVDRLFDQFTEAEQEAVWVRATEPVMAKEGGILP
jgi:hypothetical protein